MRYTATLAEYYREMWDGLTISAGRRAEAMGVAQKILVNKNRYVKIEKATGVPWHFVALTHYRESTLNFNKNLANGQPLGMRTTIVPKGRGPYRDFEESAYDALVTIKKYSAKLDWSVPAYIYRIEGFNGYGYHSKGIPSPYLVGGSNKHRRGKYIRDHVYDPNHMDTQLGVLTVLKALMERDTTIQFGAPSPSAPVPVPPPDIATTKPVIPPANTARNTTTGAVVATGAAAAAGAGAWFESWLAAGMTFGIIAMVATTIFVLWRRK